jgi:hypothetical protein
MNPTVKAYPLGKICFFSWLPEGLQFSTRLKTWRSLFKVDSLQKTKIFPTDRKTQRIKSFQLVFSIRWRFSFWLWLVHV